ncbi:MAG: RagB/SusD family nutrient uptake outer membrane protein [Tannerellaceae bacterium]|nr:RagB/SusD family nutrient uptake outer membrane protein [Tannerellaceae bacterium]
MKRIYISLLTCAILCTTSCNDSDFLDVKSQENVEAEDRDDVFTPEMFVNGVYGMFTEWDYAFSYLGITEIMSDNADKGSSPTDTGTDKDVLDNLTFTPSAGSFGEMWANWYTAIGRATQAIEYTEDYGLTDNAYKNRLIGEAKFLRALNYFFLVRGWGGVPIQEYSLDERSSATEVYAYIEKDLLDAIEVLPLKSEYESKDLGRATKGAAQGLLSKVYLYQQKWQEAYNYANTVLTSGQYALHPDYEELWRVETENGSESLFEFQGRGEQIAHGIQQYSETQAPRGGDGNLSYGWGFNVPSDNLLKAFQDEGDEIRMYGTIIFRNQILYDGRNVGATENPMYNMKAYSSATQTAADGDKNIRYLRLGEIYLIRAEATNELGNTAQAILDLNEIRARVNLNPTTASSQADLRKAIWHERRLELAFEHDRWFDLVRTGEAAEAMRANGKNFIVGKHELFPIPYQQLLDTPNIEQNPGW